MEAEEDGGGEAGWEGADFPLGSMIENKYRFWGRIKLRDRFYSQRDDLLSEEHESPQKILPHCNTLLLRI